MNRTLKLLILSDVFVFGGWGLISPILAIFINDHLIGGSIQAAGIASTIFLVVQGTLQVLFAKIFNPKDRLWMVILGTAFIAIVPFFFIFATNVWHLYIAQLIHGIGAGFAYPSWSSLFTSNLEKGKRGFQYSVYSSSVAFVTAITAYFGAVVAEAFSFELVFIITGIIAVSGLLFLFGLQKKELMKKI